METNILIELNNDIKLHEYLVNNSIWYIYLNRDSNKLKEFKNNFKEFKRAEMAQKIDKTIDNIELISNIAKFI